MRAYYWCMQCVLPSMYICVYIYIARCSSLLLLLLVLFVTVTLDASNSYYDDYYY